MQGTREIQGNSQNNGILVQKNKLIVQYKRIVLHSFSVFRHLKHFGFTRESLQRSLKIRAFSELPVTIVYNPQENVLLLIRNAKNQDLANDIKLGLDDLKMFILLCSDKLKGSNM